MEMWFSELHTPDVKHSIRVTRHLYAKRSSYQQIDIFETPEYGRVLTLEELRTAPVDMFCTVFIGNSMTKSIIGKMVTPRGYRDV